MTETWIPLWLFEDMIRSVEHMLREFAKKEGAELEKMDVLISDPFDETIKFYLRGYDKKKHEYAYAQKAVTKRLINETMYVPKPELKTIEDMMEEVTDLLSCDQNGGD